MVLNIKFVPTPDGEDAVYYFKPGRGEVLALRPDWADKNLLAAAAITYLGRQGREQKQLTGGQKEIYISCTIWDLINEPPAFTLVDAEQLPGEKIIPISKVRRKA